MIKKLNEFIREFVESTGLVDAKMQELKDLIEGMSDGQNLIYEWENKDDHQLLINFTSGDLSLRYEFDIDDLHVTKIAGDTVDYKTDVESMEEGLDLIEKDIQSILGIDEKKSNNMKYLKTFESYNFEDFTHSDMEDVKDLLEEGLTAEEIANELDFDVNKVKQIISSIRKSERFN
jgi:hypothetical protein